MYAGYQGNLVHTLTVCTDLFSPDMRAWERDYIQPYLLCDNNIQINVSMNKVTILVPADSAFNAH